MDTLRILFWIKILQQVNMQPENLVFKKPSSLSTVYLNSREFGPSFAADGDTNTCAVSALEKSPWWTVDLGDNYDITYVSISNPQPCDLCDHKQLKYTVYIADNIPSFDGDKRYHIECFSKTFKELKAVDMMIENPCFGRFLTVSFGNSKKEYLSLCEVSVFGSGVEPSTVGGGLTTAQPKEDNTQTQVTDTHNHLDHVQNDITKTTELQITGIVQPGVSPTSNIEGNTGFRLVMSTNDQPKLPSLGPSTVKPDLPITDTSQQPELVTNQTQTELNVVNEQDVNKVVDNADGFEVNGSCQCLDPSCSVFKPENVDKEKFIATIIEKLTIDTRNVSKERRRYSSAPDKRPSAKNIGSIGIVFIILVLCSIVFMDVENFVHVLNKSQVLPANSRCV